MSARPMVDLDELSSLTERCRVLAFALATLMSGSGLAEGSDKDGVLYELTALIEESAARAKQLVAAL